MKMGYTLFQQKVVLGHIIFKLYEKYCSRAFEYFAIFFIDLASLFP